MPCAPRCCDAELHCDFDLDCRAPPAGFEPATHGLGIAPKTCHCVRTRPSGQVTSGAIRRCVRRIPSSTAQWMGKRMGNSSCPSRCPSGDATRTTPRATTPRPIMGVRARHIAAIQKDAPARRRRAAPPRTAPPTVPDRSTPNCAGALRWSGRQARSRLRACPSQRDSPSW
jgi:hypothetical protein